MSPEVIQAIGGAIVAVIGALTMWQQKQVSELKNRVAELESQMEAERGRFRSAMTVIRGLLVYIDQLWMVMRNAGQEPPANPVTIPPELEDEI
ncbi:hypothetical protein SAMN04244553_3577 [Nocardia amikacinitolerans]|uniref:Uncharacterized protein n=1 Tax=Nocardia amikacinitolerans TaxID=756689 RepID=A0A285LG05_9NOCA|nr:hypothetical protein [Nocardia amikacinitolerans]SNY83909.1 hypothetical protein SAMN04244553_3577 [Nocardia amikacinitolerans]